MKSRAVLERVKTRQAIRAFGVDRRRQRNLGAHQDAQHEHSACDFHSDCHAKHRTASTVSGVALTPPLQHDLPDAAYAEHDDEARLLIGRKVGADHGHGFLEHVNGNEP